MLNRITQYTVTLGLLGAITLAAGCHQDARRIDPKGPETITSVAKLDVQDATDAAAEMSQSLLDSGILGRDGQPSTIAISSYVNATAMQIDRDKVIKKIRVTLNKAGVAQTYTTIGPDGTSATAEDAVAAHERERDAEEYGRYDRADYSLTYKILDDRVSAGRVKQVTYTFQMSLTDINSGLAVWEDEKQITKQGTRAAVGW